MPRDTDIPTNEFSAARARTILKELVGDGIPHPAESQQNAVVRERILRHFRDAGYGPQVQTATVMPLKHKAAKAVTVRNIVVRRRGSQPGRAVMLAAHYDSVPQGPGASDDGAAVAAILEIARMLRDLPPSRNDLIFLITDGEELGMLGATAFVGEHHLRRPRRTDPGQAAEELAGVPGRAGGGGRRVGDGRLLIGGKLRGPGCPVAEVAAGRLEAMPNARPCYFVTSRSCVDVTEARKNLWNV